MSAPASRSPRLSKAVIIVLALLGVALLIVVIVVGAFIWSFSGGWDGIRREAQPSDRRVIEGRAAVQEPLAADTAQLEKGLTALFGSPIAHGSADGCERGQNNWKIHDGYTLKCDAARVLVYELHSSSPDAAAAGITACVESAGWTAGQYGGLKLETGADSGSGRWQKGEADQVLLAIDAPGSEIYLNYPGKFSSVYASAEMATVDQAIKNPHRTLVTVVVQKNYFLDE